MVKIESLHPLVTNLALHVRQMVAVRGFKKRSFLKSKTLKDDKDRDAQFRKKINALTEQCRFLIMQG